MQKDMQLSNTVWTIASTSNRKKCRRHNGGRQCIHQLHTHSHSEIGVCRCLYLFPFLSYARAVHLRARSRAPHLDQNRFQTLHILPSDVRRVFAERRPRSAYSVSDADKLELSTNRTEPTVSIPRMPTESNYEQPFAAFLCNNLIPASTKTHKSTQYTVMQRCSDMLWRKRTVIETLLLL